MAAKPYWEMTTAELAEATRQFDQPNVIDQSRELTPAERARWEKAKRRQPKPPATNRRRITVSLDEALVKKVTAAAKSKHISRSQLLAEVLGQAFGRK